MDEASIKKAEQEKFSLENKGYELIREEVGFIKAILFFERISI